MSSIKQTWFGRILCALGVHALVWGKIEREYASFSLYGGCVRCNHMFAWDN